MGTGNTKADGVGYIPFQRMSRTRTDIQKFTTISVPQMITSDKTSDKTSEKIMTRLQEETAKRLQHNLDRALGK